jgi:prepilin-type N-terminal cleavage/methylation domain-containing protein
MNNKGVTITELLIVIVVMGIIGAFSIVRVSEIVKNTRINVDSFNLSFLNEVTEDYYLDNGDTNGDIFDGINTDTLRMQELVSNGYLGSTIIVQQNGASFEWSVDDQVWNLIGGEVNNYYDGTNVSYSFDSDYLSEITNDGTVSIDMSDWSTDDGYLENGTGESRIFIPIGSTTYTISVSAALSAGTSGGYGIFFDTTLDGGDVTRDNGYVLQFDRGFGSGEVIVRPRTNGSEGGAVLRINDRSLIPSKSVNPTWWTDTHTVNIVVTNVTDTTRNAEFFIDGVNVGSYSYTNNIEGEQIHTGFRGWGSSPTQFYSINVN